MMMMKTSFTIRMRKLCDVSVSSFLEPLPDLRARPEGRMVEVEVVVMENDIQSLVAFVVIVASKEVMGFQWRFLLLLSPT